MVAQHDGEGKVVPEIPPEDCIARSPPASPSPSCRVCWGELDGDPGGALVSPCQCRGSMSTIHRRCLQQWAALRRQRTTNYWDPLFCEICKAPLSDPCCEPDLEAKRQDIPPAPLPLFSGSRGVAVVKAYLLGAALSGMVGSLGGAIEGMAAMPRLFLEARRRPLEPLAPQLQRLVLGALTVPITGLGPAFYIRAAQLYLAGLVLDTHGCWMGAAVSRLRLPGGLAHLLALPLWGCAAAGVCLEAFQLALLSVLSGAQAGFVQGVWRWVVWPLAGVFRVLGRVHAGIAGSYR